MTENNAEPVSITRFYRERKARKEAESLLEDKSLKLYNSNLQLKELANSQEKMILERTKDLELAKNEALASSKTKSEFVAVMSHEIRTPINGVLGSLSLLSSHLSTKKAKELFDIALTWST
ncbi:histidine kinase dimerization/phospho-acceptor domain-containing protein [uncultured Paraglaciecola sp.]|uniref:histidine kinase dimerization/phospho-acceptor domain-containing protein n=1 Tax=uncultured Paraglaciecola sp. TaxID=1765024 RepID=UPI0025D85070|nr:histidine kinase dimerization/phospho-acceptor domain-containing protein [uncultured Paraglaciecola sp.]